MNDADNASGRSFALWGGGITDAKDSSKFRPARIVSDAAPEDSVAPTVSVKEGQEFSVGVDGRTG
ncbi:hypothetical protein [Microbacterium sp.]|uniref:hypothetical protein n=1 Tax=Microbacterium sp. TaxID=51671 RepID=UPI003F9E2151